MDRSPDNDLMNENEGHTHTHTYRSVHLLLVLLDLGSELLLLRQSPPQLVSLPAERRHSALQRLHDALLRQQGVSLGLQLLGEGLGLLVRVRFLLLAERRAIGVKLLLLLERRLKRLKKTLSLYNLKIREHFEYSTSERKNELYSLSETRHVAPLGLYNI